MGQLNIVTTAIVILIVLVLALLYYFNIKKINPLCDGIVAKLSPSCWISSIFIRAGGSQGSTCVIDSDCFGWSLAGKVACCGTKCITKDNPFQTCAGYCVDNDCGSKQCTSCTLGSDCEGWSLFGKIECIGDKGTGGGGRPPIRNGRCVIKKTTTQSVESFWKEYGSGTDWCRKKNAQDFFRNDL